MSRPTIARVVALWLLVAAARASAGPVQVELTAAGCSSRLDLGALTALLELELRSSLDASTIAIAPARGEHGAADVAITIACRPAEAALWLDVERVVPPGHAQRQLIVADVPAPARPRLVALLLAEMLHELANEVPARPTVSALPPAPRSLVSRRPRARLMRDFAVTLSALTVASVIVGAVFAGIDREHRDPDDSNLDAAISGAAFGLGGLCLAGTAVDLGLWLRQRPNRGLESPLASSLPARISVSF
jgi:hypothetical protein